MKKQLSPSTKTRLIAIAVSTLMLLLVAMSILTIIHVTKPQAPTVAVDGNDKPYNNVDYYDMPNNLIFTSSLSEETIATVNLQATISPATATDKRLEWTAKFADPNAEWANGKAISDYVNIAVDEVDNTKATIACRQAFGEQIIISVKSIDNPNAKANCTLDFARRVIGAELYYGDWQMNLGGDTEFKFNINENGKPLGGTVRCDYIFSDTYTVEDSFSYRVESYVPKNENNEDNHFSLNNTECISTIEIYNISPNPNGMFERNNFTIDYDKMLTMQGDFNNNGTIEIEESFSHFTNDRISELLSNITQPILVKHTLEITGQYSSYSISTNLKCTGYIDYAQVAEVTLPNATIVA